MAAKAYSTSIRAEQRVWVKPDSLVFFQMHRNDPRDLYLSERLFLPDLLPQVGSCLDVGCAAGGFSRIMKSFNPQLVYTGVDVNEEFIAIARRTYPDCCFELGDGVRFASPSGSFELVFVGGLLHLNSSYRKMVRGCYEQAGRFLLGDFRLTHSPSVTGRFRLDFDGAGGAAEDLPYIVLNINELIETLCALEPAPASVTLRGYPHLVSPMASEVPRDVIMAFALIEKGRGSATPCRVTVDIRERAEWEH